MKKKFYILFFTTILFLQNCCVPSQQKLTIYNYSDSAIYVYVTCYDKISYDYPLSLFYNIKATMIRANGDTIKPITSPNYRINAFSSGDLNGFGSSGRGKIFYKDQMFVFFISENSRKKYPWTEIVEHQFYIKRI